MQATLILDDAMVEAAREFTGLTETSALVSEAFRALLQREAGYRLVQLGGSDPDAEFVTRRRSEF